MPATVDVPAPPWQLVNHHAGPGPLYRKSPSWLVGGGAWRGWSTTCGRTLGWSLGGLPVM
ncbi:hypothetical protein [Actinomadura keratinilytica]|uniref:hypothetical protein n=1 Tax=Actinomadura keratinilytica TaxID=547461 RepID=UPI0031F12560